MVDPHHATKLSSRRGKERERDERDNDLYGKVIAIQRSKAAASRTRDRSERSNSRVLPSASAPTSPTPTPPSPPRKPPLPPQQQPLLQQTPTMPTPQLIISRSDAVDGTEECHRRRKQVHTVSPRTHPSKSAGKLYNPDVDPPIPVRRTAEPEAISDNGSSSYAPRHHHAGLATATLPERGHGHAQGRLFDYRKDDPVRFHALAGQAKVNLANGNRPTPTPKSSGEYVSASSTSSYAHSVTSSNFTLNSTTDGSSASSALFDGQPREHASSSAFAQQLKKLYRQISNLETKLLRDDGPGKDLDEQSRITLKQRPGESGAADAEDAEKERWRKYVAEHKQLAELMHELLQHTLAPHVPASLRNIPTKYNIIARLWTHAFNKPLEVLRRTSFSSLIASEHLQEFIIYAYNFYSMLLEEQNLEGFKSGWLEALGDLARYRMAIAWMTSSTTTNDSFPLVNTGSYMSVNQQSLATAQSQLDQEETLARIDDSPGPSVGVAAARALELEPEKDRWRNIARNWYAVGLADMPGTGRLHHHLGLLSRDLQKEELRAVYHYCKSLTALHPFNSREYVLQVWSIEAQTRRSMPDDTRVADLFVLLHGMLFTNIQMDDFLPTLERFMERLVLEDAEEREWIMMAIVNICALLEYGKPSGVLRSIGGIGTAIKDASTAAQAAAANARVNMLARKVDEMEVDDTEPNADTNGNATTQTVVEEEVDVKAAGVLNVSPTLAKSLSGTVSNLSEPSEPPLAFKYALQITFDMLAFTLRNPTRKASPFSRPTLNPYITVLLTFLATVLKQPAVQAALERAIPWEPLMAFFNTIPRAALAQAEGGVRLTSSCTPLPEDWCVRGMEWVGRRVFERGFWKGSGGDEERHVEMEVLDTNEDVEGLTDGIIEDEDEVAEDVRGMAQSGTAKRWVRIARVAATVAKVVPGFSWDMSLGGTRAFSVTGELEGKVRRWIEEDRMEREEEERRRSRKPVWSNDEEDGMDVDGEEGSGLLADDLAEENSESASDSEETEEVKALKAKRRELLQLLHQTSQPSEMHSRPRRPRAPGRSMRAHAPVHLQKPQKPAIRAVPGYTVLVIDTNILLSSLSMFISLVESLRWTILVPLAVITELDGIAKNVSALGVAATQAIQYISSHIRTHARSLKVQTSKGNYLASLNVRSEQVELGSGYPGDEGRAYSWERNMDDLILRAAVWQDDHWVDRSTILGTGERDTAGAAKVVLISFDRNLRLKARARQLDSADEKDMTLILKATT